MMLLLWRFKFLILAAIVSALIWWQHDRIQDMKIVQTALREANAAYVVTLKTIRDSAMAQINALEAESADEKIRQDDLNDIILEVETDEESDIECPVPDFMRDAFNRM